MNDENEERIVAAADDAVEAFWSTVAKAFPEVTTGDLSVEAVAEFDKQARSLISEWLHMNDFGRKL